MTGTSQQQTSGTAAPLPLELPSLPRACLQVIQATDDDDVEIDAIVKLISLDPILAAEVLRVANTAAYVRREQAVTLRGAVVVLGLRVVRRIALSFVLRVTGEVGGIPAMLVEQFWRQAIIRAAACEQLARDSDVDPDEAFLVGLLQDVGLLVLFVSDPSRLPMWPFLVTVSPEARLHLEREFFGATHIDAFKRAAKAWELPSGVVNPIVAHHGGPVEPGRDERLARLAAAGDVVATFIARTELLRGHDDLRMALEALGLSGAQLNDKLEEVPRRAEAAAAALGLTLAATPSPEVLLRAALQELSALNERQLVRVRELQKQLQERDQVATRLDRERTELKRKAYTDPLTGVANRRSFDEALAGLVLKAIAEGQPLSLITIDVDHFKKINDRFGHPFGDTVLQAVASTLTRSTRASDHRARIGGEEFGLLLYGAPASAGARIAEQVRAAIESLKLEHEGAVVPVTISVGGKTIVPGGSDSTHPAALVAQILRDADAALYESKSRGRNCVTWAGEPLKSVVPTPA